MYRIVIVEDEEIIRKGMQYAFPYDDWDCVVVGDARNGEEAIKVIQDKKPHIVLTDIEMPIMNGIEMMMQIEENISFIVISGYDDFSYVQEAMSLDAVGYLLKPIVEEDLKKQLYKAIQRYEMRKEYLLNQEVKDQTKDIDVFDDIRSGKDDIVDAMILYIESNYMNRFKLQDVCEHLHYSESLLKKRFKEVTTITFNDYLNRYRVSQAIQLMKDGDKVVHNVAELVGFSDYKYFNKVFQKYVGYSMREFMRLLEE